MKRTLAILTCLFLTAPALSASAAPGKPAKISVSGSGSVSMMPDQATIDASVVTNADASGQAMDENNRRYAAIVDAATHAGVARKDVTLSYYNVNYVPKPAAPAMPQPYQRYGFTVDRSFQIVVRNMSHAGSVVDAVTRAGATNITGVRFGLSNPAAARAQAMQKAVADARAQAESLAKAAGLHLTRIASITTGGGGPILPLAMKMNAAAAPMPTEFDSGNVTVTVNVSIVFDAAP